MTRYGFSIKTRTGQRVDNICIMAANQADAERRLRQMYQRCQIVACQTEAVNFRNALAAPDSPRGMFAGPATLPGVARSMLRNKSGTH
jgi:hypothetical protein